MGRIVFFNEESQRLFRQRKKENQSKGSNTESSLSEDIIKMMDMVDKNCSYEDILREINERVFAIEFWMGLYHSAGNSRERAEALLELRELMLVSDDNRLFD